jgi:ABC-type tungstate transport system permease subunit
MGQTLNVAAEKKAYILLTGDLLALKKNLNLVILNEGTPCC